MVINVEDSSVSFQLFDCETGDEYRQVHMESMTGEFVGQVRQACLDLLLDIRRHCFDEIGFLYEQSQRLVAHVSERYQGSLSTFGLSLQEKVLPRQLYFAMKVQRSGMEPF